MGFYGNITNVNKTSLTFDKIYANRYEMDQAVQSPEGDGIYVGRFVLVDYNEGVPAHNYTRVYQIGYEGYDNNFYFSTNMNDNTTRARYSAERYYNEDGTINDKRDDIEYQFYLFIGQIVYTFNEKDKSYQFYITKEATNTEWAKLEKIQAPVDAEPYFENFIIDRQQYGDNIGRGYDSTVWQKVYIDNQEKYVMLAELNSVVPTFDLTVDPPTIHPIKPHFDADTTNIYYKLHVQPSWGFRIKELAENDGYLSDQTASSEETIWDPILKKAKTVGKTKYDAAIYYNKQGFNADKRFEQDQPKDLITIKNTGSSNQYYNIHNERTGVSKLDTADDIQEFVFQLPSIGNTMSDIWNIIYGYGELIEDKNGVKTYRRNKNIDWNSLAGERLVTENTDGSGFTYNPEKVNTIAGCINSIHDLMGMIVVDAQKDSTDDALMHRIYYGDYREEKTEESYKGYYIKELTYDIEEKPLEDINNLIIDNMKEFLKNTYYYVNDNNYYLETKKYDSGNKYYAIEVSEPVEFYEQDYEPNKFYYKDTDGNFKLAATPQANSQINYYYTDAEIKAEEIIDNSNGIRFFPIDKDYFDEYFISDDPEKLEEINGEKKGSGWFYFDDAADLYKPFTFDITKEYIQVLYYITDYLVEKAINVDGSEEWVYEFDKGTTKKVKYTTVKFETNKFYYYQPNEENENLPGSYILLKNEKDIDIDKIYMSFPTDTNQFILIEKDFYIPNSYHCKEGNDYIFATEDKKQNEKTYYNILKSELIIDIFYEPYKYYYLDWNNEYSLDTNDIMTPGRTYYKEGVHYYVKYDPRGILKSYSKLNNALIKNLPKDVIIGPRKEKYKWRELEGFSRTLNSIHGMLLELNRIIRFEDKVTRDERTLAGTLNKINDILTTIGKLTPGQIVVTDNYGRMTTAKSSATQEVLSQRMKYDYDLEQFKSTNTVVNANGSWVGFEVTLNEEDVTTDIAFGHTYNPISAKEDKIDMNDEGNVIGIIRPVIDNMGHIMALDTEQITLPNGYKTIITGKDSAVAQNSKDSISIKPNEWIAVKAENDQNGQSIISLDHIYPTEKLVIKENVINMNTDQKDNINYIKDIKIDETGHITEKEQDVITLPYGFKKIKAEKGKEIEAKNTQDIFEIVGDLVLNENDEKRVWIETEALSDTDTIQQIKIKHSDPITLNQREIENINLQFGDSFDIEDWVFDDKGHKSNVSIHSISIPKGSLENYEQIELSDTNTIANIQFVPESGKIILERKDITDFKLKSFNSQNTETGLINFTEDTLGIALSKLQNQLTLLNSDKSVVNSVDYKISQAISKIVDKSNDDILNTLNEVIDWITDEGIPDGAVAIQTSINTINAELGNIGKTIEDKTFDYTINENTIPMTIQGLMDHIAYLENKIIALENTTNPEPTPDSNPESPEPETPEEPIPEPEPETPEESIE